MLLKSIWRGSTEIGLSSFNTKFCVAIKHISGIVVDSFLHRFVCFYNSIDDLDRKGYEFIPEYISMVPVKGPRGNMHWKRSHIEWILRYRLYRNDCNVGSQAGYSAFLGTHKAHNFQPGLEVTFEMYSSLVKSNKKQSRHLHEVRRRLKKEFSESVRYDFSNIDFASLSLIARLMRMTIFVLRSHYPRQGVKTIAVTCLCIMMLRLRMT